MKKPKKRSSFREDTGKLLLDVGKLFFGSFFLGSILRGEIPHVILGIVGLAAAIAMFILGLLLVKKEGKNWENESPVAKE